MKIKSGSALIMVVCGTSLLFITVTTSWYIAFLLHEASCIRQRCLQREHALTGLLTYATHQAHKTDATRFTYPVTIYQGPWPGGYSGDAVACQTDTTITISAILKEDDRIVARASSVLAYDRAEPHKRVVVGWNVHDPV